MQDEALLSIHRSMSPINGAMTNQIEYLKYNAHLHTSTQHSNNFKWYSAVQLLNIDEWYPFFKN